MLTIAMLVWFLEYRVDFRYLFTVWWFCCIRVLTLYFVLHIQWVRISSVDTWNSISCSTSIYKFIWTLCSLVLAAAISNSYIHSCNESEYMTIEQVLREKKYNSIIHKSIITIQVQISCRYRWRMAIFINYTHFNN